MVSKEYYDIAYGLRDLAKELNRSDVINTIDSEIKKMKFDELGKNINYSYISKTNKNKEENKDKYKLSKKKLAIENLVDENIEDVWYNDDWVIDDEDADLEEDFTSSSILNEGVSRDDPYLKMDYEKAMDTNWEHYIFSVDVRDARDRRLRKTYDERGAYQDEKAFQDAVSEIYRKYGEDNILSINALHDKGLLKYYDDLYNKYLQNKKEEAQSKNKQDIQNNSNNQQPLKNNNNSANSNTLQNSNSTQNNQQQNNFQQASKRKNNPIYRQRTKNNSKIVKALNNANIPTDKLTQQVVDKNGRKYTRATPILKKLRKDLYGESLGEDLEETSPYTNIKSNGIYSLNTGWVKHPVQQDIPDIDIEEFEKEFKVWEDKYFDLLDKESGREEIDNLIEDIYNLRKEGMEEDGEYSIKNLIFKEFRNLGYLDNLKELRKEEVSKELSLEQLNEDIQDWDKNLIKKAQDYIPMLDGIDSDIFTEIIDEIEDKLNSRQFPDWPSYTSLSYVFQMSLSDIQWRDIVVNIVPFLLETGKYDVYYSKELYGWTGDTDYIIVKKGCPIDTLYKMLSAGYEDNGDDAPTEEEFLNDLSKVDKDGNYSEVSF